MNLQDKVTEQSLYDPTPNGYSMAVNVPREAQVTYISGRDSQDSTGALSPDLAVQVKTGLRKFAHRPRCAWCKVRGGSADPDRRNHRLKPKICGGPGALSQRMDKAERRLSAPLDITLRPSRALHNHATFVLHELPKSDGKSMSCGAWHRLP
jgi:hypothetical protein